MLAKDLPNSSVPAPNLAAWAFVLVLLFVSIVFSGSHTLMGTDESREAGMSREMADTGDYVVPRLNGKPFLEKPPLEYAAAAVSMRLFGPSLPAARLPSAIFGLLATFAALSLAKRLSGTMLAGLTAATALGTGFYFQDSIHACLTNAPLIACVAVAMLAFERVVNGEGAWGASTLFFAALGCGFMSKNLFGIAVPGAAVAAYLIISRDLRSLRRMIFSPAPLAPVLIILPWLVLLYVAGQRQSPPAGVAFLRETLIANNFGRFFTGYGGHNSYDWYEVGGFLAAAIAPWTPLAAAALVDNLRLLFATDPSVRRRAQLFSSWMIAPVVLIAASKSKRPDYLVVLTPSFAVAIGVWWSDVLIDPSRRVERALLILMALGASLAPLLIAEENFLILFSPSATSIAAIGLAITLLLGAVYLSIRKNFSALAVITAIGVVALNLGSLDPVIARARDRDSTGPFGDELASAKPTGAIGTIGCGERELGMTYFYLGRTVQDLSQLSLNDRVRFIEDPSTAGVLVGQRGRHGELRTADQLIRHDFGPDAPPLHVALQGLVGGRLLLFVTR